MGYYEVESWPFTILSDEEQTLDSLRFVPLFSPTQQPGPSRSEAMCRLAAALAAAGPACTQVQAELSTYVAAETAGEPVHRLYPDLWLHIYHCPACRHQHERFSPRARPIR